MLFAARVLVLAMNFAAGVLIARSLGPQGRGTYAVAVLAPVLAAQTFSLGLNSGAVYFTGQGRYPVARIASTLFWAALGLALVSAATFAFITIFRRHRLGPSIDVLFLRQVVRYSGVSYVSNWLQAQAAHQRDMARRRTASCCPCRLDRPVGEAAAAGVHNHLLSVAVETGSINSLLACHSLVAAVAWPTARALPAGGLISKRPSTGPAPSVTHREKLTCAAGSSFSIPAGAHARRKL